MTKIIQRHDTAANWTSVNPVLAAGEIGVETDTSKFKFGNGTSTWSELTYATSGSGGSGTQLTSANGAISYSTLALGDNLVVDTGDTPWTNPAMTSNSQDGYIASASVSSSASGSAIYKAFNKDTTSSEDAWYTGNVSMPQWIMLECPEAVRLTSCKIMNEVATPENFKSAYIQGSNDGSTFDTLYTITNRPNTTGYSETYTITSEIYYKYLRVYFTEKYSGGVSIQEIEFKGFVKDPSRVPSLNVNLDELGNEVNKLSTKIENKQDRLQAGENISITTIYPDAVDNLYLQVNNTNNGNPTATTLITNPSSYTLASLGSVQMVNNSNTSNSRSWEFVARLPYAAYKIGIGTFCTKSAGWAGKAFRNIGITAISGLICTIEANNVPINVDYTTLGLTAPPSYVYFKLIQVAGKNTIEMLYSLDGSKYVSAGIYTRSSDDYGVFINGGGGGNHAIDLTQCIFQFTPAREPYDEISSIHPTATTTSLGVVQPDGTSITVNEAGVISGQDVKTFTGYSDTGTLVLKSINGVLQWVAE